VTGYAISFGRERVVIAADTAIYLPARPPAPQQVVGYTSKVYPLAHLRAAIFGRGVAQIIAETAMLVGLAPPLGTIEAVAEAMPSLLRATTERYCSLAGIDDPAKYLLGEVYLAGWSEAESRMRAYLWQNWDDWQQPRAPGDYGAFALPPLPDEEMPARRGSLDAHLVAVMRAQRRFFEAHPEHGVVVGGEVQRWEITRMGISQRVIHRFPDFGRSLDADFAAPINMAARLFTAGERAA
jgi:hypothetical protein